MNFWKYTFSFLYERNWHTGEKELSMRRVLVTVGLLGVLCLILLLAWWLQAPAEYVAR